jgi:hypothetical protein
MNTETKLNRELMQKKKKNVKIEETFKRTINNILKRKEYAVPMKQKQNATYKNGIIREKRRL